MRTAVDKEEKLQVLHPVYFGLSLHSDIVQLGLYYQEYGKQDAHCGGNWISGEGYLDLIFLGNIE